VYSNKHYFDIFKGLYRSVAVLINCLSIF